MHTNTVLLAVMLLLFLSAISERIVELLKKIVLPLIGKKLGPHDEEAYRSDLRGVIATLNIRFKPGSAQELRRIQIIILLSFLVGLFVAAWSWTLIKSLLDNHTKLRVNAVMGSFYVGICLSLGSKLWHDMIDFVFAIKTSQRYARETINTPGNEFLQEKEWLESAIQPKKQKLITQYGSALVELTPLLVRDPQVNGGFVYVIGAYFRAKRPCGFPDYIQLTGTNRWLMVKPIEDIGLPKAQCKPGSLLRNMNNGRLGSYGCVLKASDGQHYILTCAHVLTDQPGNTFSSGNLDQVKVWISETNEVLPVFRYGFAGDAGTDYALIGPVDERYSNAIDPICNLNYKQTALIMDGRTVVTSTLTRYSVSSEHFSVLRKSHISALAVIFQDGTTHNLRNLIRLDKMSTEGDSGSIIYDCNNQAVGMIVASDLAFTYALKIESIFAELPGFEMK